MDKILLSVFLEACMIVTCVSVSVSVANQRTVCVGDNTSFACTSDPDHSVFVVVFQKGTKKIGTYYNTPFINEGFKGRYSIRKEHSVFQLYITKVEASDQGQFKCKIIYENKHDETFEYYLKVQGTQMSTEVYFRKENKGMCIILTCGDKSRKVKLKGPNDIVKKGKQITLNSCKRTLMSGTYTCCVDAKCIKDCKSKTLTGGVTSDATLVSIKPQLLVTMPTVIAALWIHGL